MGKYEELIKDIEFYPPEIMELNTIEGFIEFWHHEKPNHKTYEAAYKHCESVHKKLFGRCRYSSYDSFKMIVRRKRIQKRS